MTQMYRYCIYRACSLGGLCCQFMMSEKTAQNSLPPLVVDLDDTLIIGDTLVESFFRCMRKAPFAALKAIGALFAGRAQFKDQLAKKAALSAETLVFNEDVVAYIRGEKAKGRRIVLATAANHLIAQNVADQLSLFDDVIASSDAQNVKGATKRATIIELLGTDQFDYIGDSTADLSVWGGNTRAILVGDAQLQETVRDHNIDVLKRFDRPRPNFSTYLKLMRVHQWAKNALIFLPVLLAKQYLDIGVLFAAFIAVLSFSLCASATYIWNDLLDLASDRKHPTKKNRPLASGAIATIDGLTASFVLLASAFLISAIFLPLIFIIVLLGYIFITVNYSIWVKRKMMLDVLTLAGLYGYRLMAGGAATGILLSEWLLMFSIFFFLNLALIKRMTDLHYEPNTFDKTIKGRGYFGGDIELVRTLGVTSGYMSVIVMALYVTSDYIMGLYPSPELLWVNCGLLLYWISRTWFFAHRGIMHDDPIVFALRDRVSWIVATMMGIATISASLPWRNWI